MHRIYMVLVNPRNSTIAHPQIEAPVIDLEVRSVPALSYFGNIVWPEVYDSMNAGVSEQMSEGVHTCMRVCACDGYPPQGSGCVQTCKCVCVLAILPRSDPL
jgi:hypothetical protein